MPYNHIVFTHKLILIYSLTNTAAVHAQIMPLSGQFCHAP